MHNFFTAHGITDVKFIKELSEHLEGKSIVITNRVSTYLFTKIKYPKIKIYRLRKKSIENNQIIPDSKFYKNLTEDEAKKITNSYYEEIKKILSNKNINFALMTGEYRLIEQSAIQALKERNIKTVYFEAGPPGYIYLDKNGTNYNASFAQGNDQNNLIIKSNDKENTEKKKGKRKNTTLETALLTIETVYLHALYLIKKTQDQDEYYIAFKNRLKLKKIRETKDLTIKKPVECEFVFFGQVKNDINHTHFGIDDKELLRSIEDVLDKIDKKDKIAWKDHPLEISSGVIKHHKLLNKRVIVDNVRSTAELIESCKGVITVNSNAGLEALLQGKPTLVLGKSYLRQIYGCHEDIDEFITMIESMNNETKSLIKEASQSFVSNNFLNIDYRNKDFTKVEYAYDWLILNDIIESLPQNQPK